MHKSRTKCAAFFITFTMTIQNQNHAYFTHRSAQFFDTYTH